MKNDKVISELLGWTTDRAKIQLLSDRKEQMFRESIRQQRLEPLPGVRSFLEQLQAASIPCAVASSTPRENISCVLGLLGLEGFFQAIVCAEDVTHGKPNPEVFLLAAQKLKMQPERCVVFEDAHVGIEAALRAGSKVVGVATTHPAQSLQDAHQVVHRLDQLSLAELATWFGSDRSAATRNERKS